MTFRCQQQGLGQAANRAPRLAATLDASTLREAFGSFPSGVTAVCGVVDGRPLGMAVSSFTSVSLEPPMVSVCLQRSSKTWARLRGLPWLGLSVLAEDQGPLCRALAGPEQDRFADCAWEAGEDGAVFLPGAVTWYSCILRGEVPAGDHNIALLEVDRLWTQSATEPLVFHGSRFRRLDASHTRT
ncbi:flavin reductase family protein [Nonomuraea turkmeniaca]|uniref:Flavin reductase family protein n=1 Tax=Nonomuraea turkmeniaca TaxID=103838 RepID=A0A5S4F894_9ACTN|nr:flavin reductase family protein [Nonomuraea turkmeniaca]TMR12771.1 flavin reductase family protein [Nonomuraea turkmeniaca]